MVEVTGLEPVFSACRADTLAAVLNPPCYSKGSLGARAPLFFSRLLFRF